MDIQNFYIYLKLWDWEKKIKKENEMLKKENQELKDKLSYQNGEL